MSKKATSVAFVALLFLSLLPYSAQPPQPHEPHEITLQEDLFSGFFVGEADDVWNQTPWQSVAVPQGFSFENVIDYTDVGVLINNLSEESRTIGWAFVAARNIPTWRKQLPAALALYPTYIILGHRAVATKHSCDPSSCHNK